MLINGGDSDQHRSQRATRTRMQSIHAESRRVFPSVHLHSPFVHAPDNTQLRVHAGDMLLFREGRAKGVGKLLSLHAPHNPIEGSAGSVAMTAAAAVGTVGRSEHQQ